VSRIAHKRQFIVLATRLARVTTFFPARRLLDFSPVAHWQTSETSYDARLARCTYPGKLWAGPFLGF